LKRGDEKGGAGLKNKSIRELLTKEDHGEKIGVKGLKQGDFSLAVMKTTRLKK